MLAFHLQRRSGQCALHWCCCLKAGWNSSAGVCGAQGGLADPLPANRRAHAGTLALAACDVQPTRDEAENRSLFMPQVVAQWLGKKPESESSNDTSSE